MNRILLFSFLTILTSCHRQVSTNQPEKAIDASPKPAILRTSMPKGIYPDFDTTLVAQYIRSIFQDSKGNLWFGTLGEGVVRYDVKSLKYFTQLEGFNANSVHAITEDVNGNMWFGTEQGAFKYDGTKFRRYSEKDGLSNIEIGRKCILSDKLGNIWVGTQQGVFRYIPSADSAGGQCFKLFHLLPPVNVKDIVEDNTGNIWFASQDHGVFRYDRKEMKNLTEKEGLGDNYAGGIIQDKAGNIWFTRKGGICRYDGKTFVDFTTKDGIGGSEVWGIYMESSGIIWIAARGSTTRFNPTLPISDSKAFTVYKEVDGINCCIQSMYQDKSGKMWWGAGSGLYRFNGQRFYQVKQNGPW